MITPLEQEIIDKFQKQLDGSPVSETITASLVASFSSDKLPTVESVAELFRSESGEKEV